MFRKAVALCLLVGATVAERSVSRSWTRVRGGKFGMDKLFKSDKKLEKELEEVTDSLFGDTGDAPKPGNDSFPGLSGEEIYSMLKGVPVFTVTNEEGKSLLIMTADGEKAINYFMDPDMAIMVKDRLSNSTSDALQVRGRALVEALQLRSGLAEATAINDTLDFPTVNIYASPQDLHWAMTSLQKNSTELSLNATSIPVFTCPAMMISPDNEEPMQPWFFSLQQLMETYKKAKGETDIEATVHMQTLDGLMQQMELESPINWRRSIFIPSPTAIAALPKDSIMGEGDGANSDSSSTDKK